MEIFYSNPNIQGKSFVEHNDLLSPKQYGFRPHRSTVDQLTYVMSTVTRAFDSRSLCDAVFLDFYKAFDRTSHRHIAAWLSRWCSQASLAWFTNFLVGRSMSVQETVSWHSAIIYFAAHCWSATVLSSWSPSV